MKALTIAVLLFSLSTYVFGQQLTTVNAAGATIVEQVTTNAFGQPVTQTLQTLGQGTSTTVTSTSPTTSPTTTGTTPTTTNTRTTTTPNQQGPVVGQPGTTPVTPGGPTPYTYTTTDANGDYVTVLATFTPSFTTIPVSPTGTGTILQYSEWLSQIGTNTGALGQPVASQLANPASRAIANIRVLSGVVVTTVLAGVVGGWVLIP
jgi:hypothetical protein